MQSSRKNLHAILLLSAALLASTATARPQTPEALHQMFESNQVFALRDAVQHTSAPLFYRGAVAASQNHIKEAQKDLNAVIHASPHSSDAYDAHEMLGNLYFRNGLYREALAQIQIALVERPDAADVKNALPLFTTLAKSPDMKVVSRKHTTLHTPHGGRSLPINLDGKDVSYGFDTGANLSVMSESEARRAGLTTEPVSTKLSDASGNGISGFRVAVAKDLVIGGLHVKNVPFLVLPDSGEPFAEMPENEINRGLLGIPVLIAMQTIRWGPAIDLEFAFATPHRQPLPSNMLFHDITAVVEVGVQDKVLNFSLDTGATDTDLNASLARALPDLMSTGQKETHSITGMGGTTSHDSILLPSIAFHVGGRDVTLKPAHVFVEHSLGIYAGNLGNDLLNQAHAITLDFHTMSLKLD